MVTDMDALKGARRAAWGDGQRRPSVEADLSGGAELTAAPRARRPVLRTVLSAFAVLLVLALAGRQLAGPDLGAVWDRLRAAEPAPLS